MEQMNQTATDDHSQLNAAPSGTNDSTNTATNTSTNDSTNFADRARGLAGSAQEKLADVGTNVRERAGHMKTSLADALETGADTLRTRAGTNDGNPQLAGATPGATGSATVAVDGDSRLGQVTQRVAGGMDATAGWLRDADLDGLRSTIEEQVKEHPGRSLLIAAGLGYLVGKALRK